MSGQARSTDVGSDDRGGPRHQNPYAGVDPSTAATRSRGS